MDSQKDATENLGSSDGSSSVFKARAERCVTHYFGCDCREYRYERMRNALHAIHNMVVLKPENTANAVLIDIGVLCHRALYE